MKKGLVLRKSLKGSRRSVQLVDVNNLVLAFVREHQSDTKQKNKKHPSDTEMRSEKEVEY